MENYIGLILDERNDHYTIGYEQTSDLQKLKEWQQKMLGCTDIVDCKILKVEEIKNMTIKEKIEEKIKIAKADIKVCMDDFNRTGEVNHEFPIGETYVEHSKSEVYHRGRLLGLEEALRLITESE